MRQLLFDNIDQPGLNTLEVYRASAAATRCSQRALDMEPGDVLAELQASGIRGRGGAGFAMGTKASFIPKGDMDKYVVCNADESEPGTFKDRELMQKNPHLLIEGICIAAHAIGANKAFIFIRGEYDLPGRRSSRRRSPRPRRRTLIGDARPVGPPRRRRLHLRRGDRAARRARGQARQPAPEAAVPGRPGPLPGPDADQQRRDADERPAHPADGRRGVRQDRHGALDRHEGRLRLGLRAAPGQLRDRARRPVARDHLRPRRRAAARAARSSSGSPAARARRCSRARTSTSTCPTTSTRWPRPARCSARARSSSSTTPCPVVDVALKTAKFYRHESCGKCTPCREGTNWTVKMLERIDNGEATPMDLDIMASVCDQIIGNCLCVLGDAMAMPIALDDQALPRRSSRRTSRPRASATELGARREPHQPRRARRARTPRRSTV